MIIMLNSEILTGTYFFATGDNYSGSIITNNPTSDTYYAGNSGGFPPYYLVGSGSITISEISKKHVKGTFSFITATNGVTGVFKNISNGDFDINRD
jgi:hypothetical protein